MPQKAIKGSSTPKTGGPSKTVSRGSETRGGVTKLQAAPSKMSRAEMLKKLDHSYNVQAGIRSTDTRSAKDKTSSFLGGVFNAQVGKNLENIAGQTTDFLRSPVGQGLLSAASFIPGVGVAARAIGVASEVGGSILDQRRGREANNDYRFTQDVVQRTAERYQPQYQPQQYREPNYGDYDHYGRGNMNAFYSGAGFAAPPYGQIMDRNRGIDPEVMYERNVQRLREDPRINRMNMMRGGLMNFSARDPGADEYAEEDAIDDMMGSIYAQTPMPARVRNMTRSAVGAAARNQPVTTNPFRPETHYRRNNPYMQMENDAYPDDFSIQGSRFVPGPDDYDY